MQLLFSFDQDMWVEKTPIQTLVCQLSSTLMQILFPFDRDMRFEKTLIKTLACQLHQLPCNFCSCLTRTRELRKLSYKLSLSTLINSQVTLVPVWLEHESWGNTRPKSWPCDTKLKYPEKHAIFGGPLIDTFQMSVLILQRESMLKISGARYLVLRLRHLRVARLLVRFAFLICFCPLMAKASSNS